MNLFFLQSVIQNNTLDDRSVHTKQDWDSAIKFMETSLKQKLEDSETNNIFEKKYSFPVYKMYIICQWISVSYLKLLNNCGI